MEKTSNYHHGNLRQTLLDIACEHIRNKGVDGLSLRAIAKQAGVSANAPYRHFADKRALLIAIAVVGFEELVERMKEVEDIAKDVLDEFQLKGKAYIQFAGDCPEKYKLMFGPAIGDRLGDPDLVQAAGDSYEMLLRSIRRGIEQGVFRDVPVQDLADPTWAMVHGISSLLIDGFFEQDAQKFRQLSIACPASGECSLETLLENNLRLIMHGILA